MSQLTGRNIDILRIIVEEYLSTGSVLGSKALLKKYDLGVSPATVRNDMARLEGLSLIYQPYNSAGRMPTTKGLRAFVNYLMSQYPDYFLSEEKKHIEEGYREFSDYIHALVYELSKNTEEIAFALIPEKSVLAYAGIATFLQSNQKIFGKNIFNIIHMLEDKFSFSKFIQELPLSHGVNVFIGEENIIAALHDYTVIVKQILVNGEPGYVGVIGGLKMNYSFNISAVRGVI